MNLVVEYTDISAPWSSGRWSTGVRNVLSTASLTPASFAISAQARISVRSSVGFAGVSTKINLVFGWTARRTSSVSVESTNVHSIPYGLSNCWNRRVVPPYTPRPQTTWSPDWSRLRKSAVSAASPVPKQTPAGASSSLPSVDSRRATLGLDTREY